MMTDGELLRRYTETNSESSFAELVERHLALVYSAALRQVNGDAHLAQDVAQTVFADLARKAVSLANRPVLTGWLYTSAHFAATKAVRTEQRRQTREQEAHLMNELLSNPAPDLDWEKLRPVLDAAMLELNETDREAVLLRYFDNRPHAEIADRLGLSENAARMRVERALEKLHALLSSRGVSTTAALSVVISANAVQLAPAGLAVTLSTAAALAGTTVATAATATAVKTIAMTTLQKTLITATIAAAVGTGIYEARQASTLRTQVQTLRQQQAPVAEQNQQLIRERDDAARQLAALRDENERLNRNVRELLKLRGEVGLLKREQSGSATASQKQLDELKEAVQSSEMKAKTTRTMLAVTSEAGSFAWHNNGLYPTNIAELQDRFSEAWLRQAGLHNSEDLGLDRFELVPHVRRLTTEDYGKLLLRERVPRRDYSTKRWVRLYTYVGSVSTEAFSDDGNFDAWESEEMKHPTLKQPTVTPP